MRELIIGIFIALLCLVYGICGYGKFAKKMARIDSIVIFIITLVVCLIFKRPDMLKNSILLGITFVMLIDLIIMYFKGDKDEE